MSLVWITAVVIAAAPMAESKPAVAAGVPAPVVGDQAKPIAGVTSPLPSGGENTAGRPGVLGQSSEAGRPDTPASRQLRDEVQASLRRWNRTSDAQAPAAAAELLGLLSRLQADTQLPAAQREELIGRVRARLIRLADQIARRLAAEQMAPEKTDAHLPPSVSAAQTAAVMAQWGNFARPGMPGAWGRPGGFPQGMPGPVPAVMPGVPAGGGAAASDDAGWELVELIRKCIAPAHWDVNGGPGSVQYWRPRRVLVVTASGEVHEQVHDLVEQLHRAGR